MMIPKLFNFELSGKKFCQKILRSKKFKQKLRHQAVEAESAKGGSDVDLKIAASTCLLVI